MLWIHGHRLRYHQRIDTLALNLAKKIVMERHRSLTNLQRELLELFALDLPEKELLEIRRMLARYFAGRATADLDQFLAENELTSDDLKRWAYEHERAATDRP